MRYWDSSALFPLIYPERTSDSLREVYRKDPHVTTWVLTPVEIGSALARKRREGEASAVILRARQFLAELERNWTEIRDLPAVRQRALRLVEVHPLRAADALQLAAALVGVREQTQGTGFVTLDQALAEAAQKEGFEVSGG